MRTHVRPYTLHMIRPPCPDQFLFCTVRESRTAVYIRALQGVDGRQGAQERVRPLLNRPRPAPAPAGTTRRYYRPNREHQERSRGSVQAVDAGGWRGDDPGAHARHHS